MDTMNIIMQWNIQMNKKLAMKHGVEMNSRRKKTASTVYVSIFSEKLLFGSIFDKSLGFGSRIFGFNQVSRIFHFCGKMEREFWYATAHSINTYFNL